ncbi:MAG: hypothetical protein IJ093_02185 [Bacilli bacterium]|nr:hypothetical protein [Bacilli bacterium]
MNEKVLSIIEGHNKAISYEEIMEKLTLEEAKELGQTLVDLEKNLKIRTTNKGKYEKFRDLNQKVGTLIVNPKGFGFVTVDGEDEDYHVSKENMKNAINGDVVVISVINDVRREAAIKRVNERNLNDLLVGEFYIKDSKNFINLDDDKLKIVVEIPEDKTKNAVTGH